MKVEKISRRLFLKSSSIMALSALSFNSGMTVFADDSGDRENFRTEEYHKYDFDTGEESIEKIVFETNSLTDEETSAGYFPNGKIPNFDILDPSAIVGNNDIVVVDNPASSPYCAAMQSLYARTMWESDFASRSALIDVAPSNLKDILPTIWIVSSTETPPRAFY